MLICDKCCCEMVVARKIRGHGSVGDYCVKNGLGEVYWHIGECEGCGEKKEVATRNDIGPDLVQWIRLYNRYSAEPTNSEMVKEFHQKFNHPCPNKLQYLSPEYKKLRLDLIDEELEELNDAMFNNDTVEMADALADLLYVIYGTAIAAGIPIDIVFKEVHRSNMSKLGEDGKPIFREDGKVLKGPNYFPPNIATVIDNYLNGSGEADPRT